LRLLSLEFINGKLLVDTSSYLFLKWADRQNDCSSWVSESIIRYSDIVLFSFLALEIPETEEALEALFNELGNDYGKVLLEFI
jgi:hypothetical protein